MTVKELANELHVAEQTVKNAIYELRQVVSGLFDNINRNSQGGYLLNEKQATAIKLKLQNHSKVMTVDEVASVLGYDSEYLRKKCAELGYTQNGKKTLLNEEQVTTLKSMLVPRTSDMKVRGQNTVTHLEMLQNIQRDMQWLISYNAELQAENERQAQQLKEQAPKVDFYNAVAQSPDCIDMECVAKVLNVKGYGRNNLFKFLREKGILDRVNKPKQRYIDAGYFRILENSYCTPDGITHINIKTVVYQKGLDFIRKLLQSVFM